MKTLSLLIQKKIIILDIIFQFFLIIASVIILFTEFDFLRLDFTFMYFYFLLGSWQLLSFILFLILKKRLQVYDLGKRNLYGILLLIICFFTIWFLAASYFSNEGHGLFIFLFGLLFVCPFIAIFYNFILFAELEIINLKLKNAL